MFDLVVLNGSRAGARFELTDVPVVLGRSPEAHLRIDDPWISNMHALFEARGDALWVVDLGSRNGTFVDQGRIEEARLAVGALLAFGRTEVRVEHLGYRAGRVEQATSAPVQFDPATLTARDLPRHELRRGPEAAPEPAAGDAPAGPAGPGTTED